MPPLVTSRPFYGAIVTYALTLQASSSQGNNLIDYEVRVYGGAIDARRHGDE